MPKMYSLASVLDAPNAIVRAHAVCRFDVQHCIQCAPAVDLVDLVGEPGVLEADPPTPSDAHALYFRLFLVGLWPLILTFPFSLAHGP